MKRKQVRRRTPGYLKKSQRRFMENLANRLESLAKKTPLNVSIFDTVEGKKLLRLHDALVDYPKAWRKKGS
jgi:hypothetical protein